jgi:Cd2+/Zn2+-exporting ATPase
MIVQPTPRPRPSLLAPLLQGERGVQAAFTLLTLVLLVYSIAATQLEALPHHFVIDLAAYFFGGYYATREALPKLLRLDLDVDFLMVFAALGAAFIGQWHEGATLLFLFSLSNVLQSYAMERSRAAVGELMQGRPDSATLLRDGEEIEVPIDDLKVEDVILIRPGEMLPTDGVVRSGESEMNEASITGEARPVMKAKGEPVFAGALNGSGAVEVEVTRPAGDSTIARIVKMIENAEQHKARTQRVLDAAEGYYAWFITLGSGLLVLIPWLYGEDINTALYRAMTVLVVASPCALVISTPAAILSAIARGARSGVLFKGGAHLERMADISVVLIDKTGTLTTGEPGVTDIVLGSHAPDHFTEDNLLAYAAALEARSEHVLAQAIIDKAAERGLQLPAVDDFITLPGRGIRARIEGFHVWIGANRLYREHGETIPQDLLDAKARLEAEGKTVLILHREIDRKGDIGQHEASGGWLGCIALLDTLRPDAREALAALKRLGIQRTIMITGDNPVVAERIGREAGIDEVRAGLLPEQKVEIVKEMMQRYGAVMMIGDGVNDAPALAHATVGVAMGAKGTDLALESAGCVLMGGELRHVAYALELSRRAMTVVKQNLIFSLAVIILLIASVFAFTLPMPLGVLGHEGSTLIVVANGLRLLGFRLGKN